MLHARLLQYVDEVARQGSIRAAAGRLHVAPSAINRQILLLEGELGEELFERLPRGMRPTPAGEVLLAHIRHTMQEYRETLAEMQALRALPSGEVTVATMTGLASSVVSTTAVSFHRRCPTVQVSIRTMFAHDIVRAIVDSETDLGIGFSLPSSGQAHECWRADTSLGAVLSADHPLARLPAVSLAQCAGYPLVFADQSMVIHGLVAEAFESAALDVNPIVHTNSIEAMKRIASTEQAIAFLSRYDIAEEQRDGRLVFVEVTDRAFGTNTLSLVQRGRQRQSLASRLFAAEMINTLESVRLGGAI